MNDLRKPKDKNLERDRRAVERSNRPQGRRRPLTPRDRVSLSNYAQKLLLEAPSEDIARQLFKDDLSHLRIGKQKITAIFAEAKERLHVSTIKQARFLRAQQVHRLQTMYAECKEAGPRYYKDALRALKMLGEMAADLDIDYRHSQELVRAQAEPTDPEEWKPAFIRMMERTDLDPHEAARAANTSWTAIRLEAERDPEFAHVVDIAIASMYERRLMKASKTSPNAAMFGAKLKSGYKEEQLAVQRAPVLAELEMLRRERAEMYAIQTKLLTVDEADAHRVKPEYSVKEMLPNNKTPELDAPNQQAEPDDEPEVSETSEPNEPNEE